MTYTIDPASFGGMFALPARLVDELLPMASGSFLKVIVYVYRHADAAISPAEIAGGTGVPEAEVSDALLYWTEKGLLLDGTAAAPVPASAEESAPADQTPEPPPKEIVRVKPQKPTYAMICRRMKESAAVRELFAEAQVKLGRTIGTADQASLLLLHDYYGLPVEIILTLCEYARSHGKGNNVSYIYSVGVDWSRREIDTLELADAEFRKLEGLNVRWTEFRKRTGLKNPRPTAPQQKYFDVWTGDWQFSDDMLSLAFDEMSKNADGVSFAYMNRILAEWRRAGIDTPEAAAEREKRFREEKDAAAARRAEKTSPYGARSKKADPDEPPASYDIEKAMEEMMTARPKVKKKERR